MTRRVRPWLRAPLMAVAVLVACAMPPAAAAPTSVFLEELTWTELRDRVAAGTTIALIPIGGTEQNGPHMTLGKHNVRVRLLAQRIAMKLGTGIVAPVVAYVPEGAIDPPTQHMRFAGTITVPEAAFEATLESAARSLQRAGLKHVFLLGDHGGYRKSLDRVAARVQGVHALPEYYRASYAEMVTALKAQGFSDAQIGEHAGLADTALMLAIDPSAVRIEAARQRPPQTTGDGARGDPRAATAQIGAVTAASIVERSVNAIRAVTDTPGRGSSGPNARGTMNAR